jgi:hypothetical protein
MAVKARRSSFFCPAFFCWHVCVPYFSARHFSAGMFVFLIFLPGIFLLACSCSLALI